VTAADPDVRSAASAVVGPGSRFRCSPVSRWSAATHQGRPRRREVVRTDRICTRIGFAFDVFGADVLNVIVEEFA
jgi:hypothetical protein